MNDDPILLIGEKANACWAATRRNTAAFFKQPDPFACV